MKRHIVFILLFSGLILNSINAQESKEIRLLVRGDDIGMSHSANEACIEAYKNGVLRSVEVMVPCPWYPEAVKLLNENPGLEVGLHLVLTSEWEGYKWRPLTEAPSIADDDGYFYPLTWPNKNYPDSVALLNVSCQFEVQRVPFGGKDKSPQEKEDQLVRIVEELEPGTWMLVDHPGYDTPEMKAITHKGYENVAEDRAGVTAAFTSEKVLKVIKKREIELITYQDLVSEPEQKPNVIFLLIDDQRNTSLGCAGHPIIKTPVIDDLASEGVRFSNAFVTTSICAASRASIFTGMHERTHQFTFNTKPLSQAYLQTSYPVLLKEAGFYTGFIGKFGVEVEGYQPHELFDNFRTLGRWMYFKKQQDGSERHITELMGDYAGDFLKNVPDGEPFCLSLSFNASHAEDADKENHYPWPKAVDGMYEESLRVPLIIYDPRLPEQQRGKVEDKMALNIDVSSTILDICGVDIPQQYEGRNLFPIVEGEDISDWRTDFFCEHLMETPTIPKWEGIRDKRYVCARYFEQDPAYEFLHDLEADPDQLMNFVTDPEYPSILETMRFRSDELKSKYESNRTGE